MPVIYTRTGDSGESSVKNGRFRKDELVFDVLGTLDELNTWLGCARDEGNLPPDTCLRLETVQRAIIDLSADIAGYGAFKTDLVRDFEREIDRMASQGSFRLCLPAGTLHVARAVCRRAERLLVAFNPSHAGVSFINRLSDYLYALAEFQRGGVSP